MRKMHFILLSFILIISIVCPLTFGAEYTYPNHQIVLICPWAPGGGSDLIARTVAKFLEDDLKQSVVVVNKTGGNGVVGYTEGVKASPDGYTLIEGTTEIAMLHWMSSVNITYRNFIPVALVNTDPAGVIVRANSPWKSLEDLQNAIKLQPGKFRAS